MVNYREILRLHSLGYSKRSIESSVGSSHQTVKDVLDRAKEMHIEWPLDEDITNVVLNELLFERQEDKPSRYAPMDYEYIHTELSKKGVTLSLRTKALHEYPVRRQVSSLGSCDKSNNANHAQARRDHAGRLGRRHNPLF